MNIYSRGCLERELFSGIPEIRGKKIVIYGMGNTARLYQEGFSRLAGEGFHVRAYCDSDPEKLKEKEFCGCPVVGINDLVEQKDICVLICTPVPQYIKEISLDLNRAGIKHYLLDEVILKYHAREVLKCYDLLTDVQSKRIYTDIILSHLKGKYPDYENCMDGEAYFLLDRFRTGDKSEIFIDCGSYVGDTIENYIRNRGGIFDKVYAFEPDPQNFAIMERRVKQLQAEWSCKPESVQLFPYGVADRSTNLMFEIYAADNGLGSKFVTVPERENKKGESVRVVALDEFISEKYTLLKADIESYEYKMLLGAKKGIKKYRPLLAICIYHNAVDLYSIPLLIKSLVSEYHVAVRHHSNTLLETVLYCWCD